MFTTCPGICAFSKIIAFKFTLAKDWNVKYKFEWVTLDAVFFVVNNYSEFENSGNKSSVFMTKKIKIEFLRNFQCLTCLLIEQLITVFF